MQDAGEVRVGAGGAGDMGRGPSGESAEERALFVYGTLMFPEVLRALLGRVPESAPAVAEGWRAARLPGQVYPVLVPAGEGTARGLLITGLTAAEWRVLDEYEGPMYELRPVELTDGRRGHAYVTVDPAAAAPDDWDAERFVAEHLDAYLGECGPPETDGRAP
ncbi:gamma-glutamylcyclotransferase family protein [Planomonospora corallina]|uniref:Putative gamma-glutamylcyclotransferase n=1 Tax=Planomonospora corallina TaxID=1806052 RepID=A0ABV8ID68_9ACTN